MTTNEIIIGLISIFAIIYSGMRYFLYYYPIVKKYALKEGISTSEWVRKYVIGRR